MEAQRPSSPPVRQELFQRDLIAPMGCELVVHNVSPTEMQSTTTDVVDYTLRVTVSSESTERTLNVPELTQSKHNSDFGRCLPSVLF
jgi:protein associated with RNAse G/E